MGSLFRSPPSPVIQMAPVTPATGAAEMEAQRRAEAARLRRMRGRGSTQVTGARGLVDEDNQTAPARLLGQ